VLGFNGTLLNNDANREKVRVHPVAYALKSLQFQATILSNKMEAKQKFDILKKEENTPPETGKSLSVVTLCCVGPRPTDTE
jgi:hypothetical protein